MSAVLLAVVAYGVPAPQGSKSAFRNKHTGKIQQVETSKRVKPWREAVKEAALDAMGPAALRCSAAVAVDMTFSFDRPRSHYRTGRNAHLLRDAAPAFPSGTPDLSKLARSTEDALVDAGVLLSDALIVEYGRLAKVYVGEGVDALDRQGVVVRLRVLPTRAEVAAALEEGTLPVLDEQVAML